MALGRLLHQQADILLLDEPTRGVDIGSNLSGGGYLSVQDGFVFGGFSNSSAKFDTRTLPMTMLDTDSAASGAQPASVPAPTTATSTSAPCSATW